MTTRQPLYKSLYFQVIVAIVIGILLGHFYPETGVALKPLGDGFIKLIKMVIAPIIFCTVVSGIAGMQSMKSVGKTGGYALLYFEVVSTIALLIGIGVAVVFGNRDLGLLIAAAMLINIIVAGFAGVLVPLALERAGADPAVASSVFVTMVTDSMGFLAVLGLATATGLVR